METAKRDDFLWEYNDEPHATRRRQILGINFNHEKFFKFLKNC
jgi:hypothetical protein